MKTYFIVNPAAGKGKINVNSQLIEDIEKALESLDIEGEIYITKFVGDGEKFVKAVCQKRDYNFFNQREEQKIEALENLRFFACGGDGTLNEVINGAFSFENVEIGCIPTGTGNDTIRSVAILGGINDNDIFADIRCQLEGESIPIDLIGYEGNLEGKPDRRYCINMFNIGFDCNVVELTDEIKKKPLFSGSFAYLVAVFKALLEKKTINLTISMDGKILSDEEVLLCAVANGSFCGGGIYSSPQALMNDGYFDVNIIKDVSRFKFLTLFPKYKKGTHLGVKEINTIFMTGKCKNLKISPKNGGISLCVDGEICHSEEIDFSMAYKGINFILPKETS